MDNKTYKLDLSSREVRDIGYKRSLRKNRRLLLVGISLAVICFVSMLWTPSTLAMIVFGISFTGAIAVAAVIIRKAERAGRELLKLVKGEYDENQI